MLGPKQLSLCKYAWELHNIMSYHPVSWAGELLSEQIQRPAGPPQTHLTLIWAAKTPPPLTPLGNRLHTRLHLSSPVFIKF